MALALTFFFILIVLGINCDCEDCKPKPVKPKLNGHYNCLTCGVKRVVHEIPAGATYICPLCREQKWEVRGNTIPQRTKGITMNEVNDNKHIEYYHNYTICFLTKRYTLIETYKGIDIYQRNKMYVARIPSETPRSLPFLNSNNLDFVKNRIDEQITFNNRPICPTCGKK